MGGPSAEHEVSLKSGRMVLAALNKKKFAAKDITITKSGRWPIFLSELKNNFDVVFIAMHGEYGEDGTLQAILEKQKIPYTGSNSKASRLGMDKGASSLIFQKKGLSIPEFIIVESVVQEIPESLHCAVVVKPADRGSSVGTSVVRELTELAPAIKNALRHSKLAMIQKFIAGREFTCGVLEKNGKLVALPPTEIIPKGSSFFDYKAKYTKGASAEITPPNLPKKQIKKIQRIALTAHRAIHGSGFSRTDVILGHDNKFYVLEINTIPGMTQTSLLPQQAKVAGIPFPKLLEIMIASALKKR